MYRVLWLFMGLALAALPASAASTHRATTTFRYRPPVGPQDVRYRYFVGMLNLALRETRADYGEYRLVPASVKISQSRALRLVAAGRYLNLAWAMTSKKRERGALPIRIPLLRGLLGVRVLLVRPNRVRRFASITTLRGLAPLIAVQGYDWPDTRILRANGLQVTTSGEYAGMFRMVMQGRVDYFPRSIAEVWDELQRLPKHSLEVSPSPVLYYRAPIYFFVNRHNKVLAARIHEGLRRALMDGSFERQFLSSAEIRKAVAFLRRGHYHLLRLKNPSLPEKTPLSDASLWFQLPQTRSTQGAPP